MNILSLFVTSNKVYFLANIKSNLKTFEFSYYPSFQTNSDLEFLVNKFLESIKLTIEDVNVIPISTVYEIVIFWKTSKNLTQELTGFTDFTYIYFDNLNFYSSKNISATSLGLSKRSDNFISNRHKFATPEFTGDVEEIVFLSKSIIETYKSQKRKIVIGGDYFTNPDIPNEYKMNLISEIMSAGFYEVYIDSKNEFPNILNLKNSTSVPIKEPEFEKFIYLITTEKDAQLLFKKEGIRKYLEIGKNETYFLHFNELEALNLEFKGREISKGSLDLDSSFAGIFVDKRSLIDKKNNLGVESFRKVLNSIDRNNDYSSL